MSKPYKLACLISGGGRTVLNLAERIDDGTLAASIDLVIASKEDLPGVSRCRDRGLEVRIASKGDFPDPKGLHDAITGWITEADIDLVCLCGYLRLVRMDPPLLGRVINIHPALLPEFGGKGLYGMHVHRAVLDSGRKVSGCTVHFVDEIYDHGPTIIQRVCPVLPGDDAQTLSKRVFEQECRAFPEAITLFIEDRVKLEGSRAQITARSD